MVVWSEAGERGGVGGSGWIGYTVRFFTGPSLGVIRAQAGSQGTFPLDDKPP